MLQAQKAATWVGKAVIVKGAGRWKIPATVRSWITFDGAPGGACSRSSTRGHPEGVAHDEEGRCPGAGLGPVPAQQVGLDLRVIAGADGRRLATKATTAAIVAELERRAGGETPKAVKVKIARHAPKLTTEQPRRRRRS